MSQRPYTEPAWIDDDPEFDAELLRELEEKHGAASIARYRTFTVDTDEYRLPVQRTYLELEGRDAFDWRAHKRREQQRNSANARESRSRKLPSADALAAELRKIMNEQGATESEARAILHTRYSHASAEAINKKLRKAL
jgi:hypothetical protein